MLGPFTREYHSVPVSGGGRTAARRGLAIRPINILPSAFLLGHDGAALAAFQGMATQ